MAFTEAQLGVSQDEIDKIKAALVNDGQANAIAVAMAEAEQMVDDACALWTVPVEVRRKHWRTLVLFDVRTRLGSVPESLAAEVEKARAALEGIRTGKHSYAERAPIRPRITGRWGGAEKFSTGSEATQETTNHSEGEGSPEGEIDGALYDTRTDTLALREYVKMTTTGSTGWQVVNRHSEGRGSPEGTVEGYEWDTYEDTLTGDQWIKTDEDDGGNTGWVNATAGGGGGGGSGGTHTNGTGSPEGAVDGDQFDTYFDENAGHIYVKSTDGGNTGWFIGVGL